jgi:hypothetical protein
MTLGTPACVEVHATVESTAKDTLTNIDVFGRIYDANGANALDRVRHREKERGAGGLTREVERRLCSNQPPPMRPGGANCPTTKQHPYEANLTRCQPKRAS